ncbi:MAG TPA: hypothetical protein VHY35_06365 [Stellaceae bacterium]|jgi:hypothetical protein|nr:hypothetical protein [Stellaceae bacterium]
MIDRETREILTPRGHTLKVYTYITGKEARALRAPYLRQADELPKSVIDEKGLRASIYETVENLALKTIVVTFDGKHDGLDDFDLLETLLTLPASEFKFITTAINEIIGDGENEEKKTN